MPTTRAAAYARYSTDNQRDSCTIAAQLKGIMDYCLKNDLDLVASFVDEAQTGTNRNRKGFSDLLHAAQEKQFEAVVIYDLTRGSRDVVDWFSFRKEMQALGITVLSATENLGDISDPSAFLTELITVGIGQHHVLQSRQKSAAGKRIRAEKGLFCGGYAPLGYKIENGQYVIVEHEAEGVRLAFEWYAAGRSYNEITAELRRMGIVGRRGQFIANNTLYFILRNERYTGRFVWFENEMRYMHKWVGKKADDPVRIENAIPRIISDDLWERVQIRVTENKHNKTNKSRRGREYILSGLLHCAKCGGAYVGTTTTSKGREYKSYICSTKQRHQTCKAKNIRADRLEPHVVALLKDSILNGDLIEKTADVIIESRKQHDGATKEDLNREIATLETKKRNLLKAVEDGFDSQSARDRIGELEAQQKILADQVEEAVSDRPVNRERLVAKMKKDAQRLLDDPTAIGELIREYIVRIDVGDKEIVVYAVADLADKQEGPQLTLLRSCGHDWLPR